MKTSFVINEPSCLRAVVDRSSLTDGLFTCLGQTSIEFNGATVRDNLEVVMRIAECVATLDMIIDGKLEPDVDLDFTFQFENRFFFRRLDDVVSAYDREAHSMKVDEFSLNGAIAERDRILAFIESDIAPISPYLANLLISRDVI